MEDALYEKWMWRGGDIVRKPTCNTTARDRWLGMHIRYGRVHVFKSSAVRMCCFLVMVFCGERHSYLCMTACFTELVTLNSMCVVDKKEQV